MADPAGAPSLDRIRAVLLLGAAGDALGYPVEFLSGAEVDDWRSQPPTEVSDDTQMTLFTVEGAIRWLLARRDAPDIAPMPFFLGAYQRWLGTQRMSPPGEPRQVPRTQGKLAADVRLYARRAPGNTCMSAVVQSFSQDAGTVDAPLNDSKGCGAIMRAAPFGLIARSEAEAFRLARDAGALTHGHPSGYLSGAYLAALVFGGVHGASLDEAMRSAGELLVREREAGETRRAASMAKSLGLMGLPSRDAIEAYGGGWVGEEALAIALGCALGHRGARDERAVHETLWAAVAHDGDSDSTGSIAGNLLGAFGVDADALGAWQDRLELRDLIDELAQDLHGALTGRELSPEAYPPRDGVLRMP